MRILQVIDSASVGGAEENTALLSQELARRGHAILLASPDGPYTDRFDALEGVETVRLPLRDGIFAARTALGLTIQGWAPDLVHSHMLRADVALAQQNGGARYRRATTIHNMFNLEVASPLRRGIYRLLAAWAYRRFDAILPVSHFVARYLRRYLWVGDKCVRVVANGIDAEGFRRRAASAEALPIDEDRRVVLSVGRLDQNKGQELILEAVARLERDDVEVWLVGDGPCTSLLRKRAEELGVACRLLGYRDDVPALMRRADVVVQPSRWEALPNTVLEALALGRPVVATRTGGTPEVVRDGETGWLTPVDGTHEIAAAIAQVLADPCEGQRRGEAGQRLVDECFTIARSAELLLSHPRLQHTPLQRRTPRSQHSL